MGCCQDATTATTTTESTADNGCCGAGAQDRDTCCATSTPA